MLETIENIDRENILATSKKIFYQRTRKELMGQNFEKTKNFAELKYAQEELVRAMGQKVVIYTSPAYVEGLEIIEPKAELTEQTVILRYKNQILNSFGISFLSNESKSSFNSVQVSVDELLKTVNKIIEQFENTINKYIRLVCIDNGIDPNFIPVVNIEKSELLDNEAKLKLVELIYSKLGFSYKTVCEILEMDYNTEVERRKEENDNGLDDVFYPHITSYTAKDSETSDVAIDKGDLTPTEVNTNSNGSQKNENLDQNAENKARKDGQL
jgi:hypothetical protein